MLKAKFSDIQSSLQSLPIFSSCAFVMRELPNSFFIHFVSFFCIEFVLEKEKVHEVLLWLICLELVQYVLLMVKTTYDLCDSFILYVVFNRITDAMEALFIIAFTVEMVLRFLAVGLTDFLDDRKKMNHPPVF